MNEEESLFRKKTIERISSPEQLTDYLRVTNPGIWIVLAAVIVLLAGIFAWSAVGTLETTVDARIIVDDHRAQVVPVSYSGLKEGMTVRASSNASTIASVEEDEFGRITGIAELRLPDGIYDGVVVTDSVHAIDFLLKNR